MDIFIGFIGSLIFTIMMLPYISKMLVKADFVRPNFRGDLIPLGTGLVFTFSGILTLIVIGGIRFLSTRFGVEIINNRLPMENYLLIFIYLFGWCSMTLLGLLDDVFGSREASGLKGHFKKLLFEKELTTGGLKALAGGFIGLIISIAMAEWMDWGLGIAIVNGLIIALSTNVINLLDLRPGRAGKGFLLFTLSIIAIGIAVAQDISFLSGTILIAPLIIVGSVMAFLPQDLKAKSMMGDTGSNTLGVTLGIAAITLLPIKGLYIYLGFLILFHIFTEKFSLTKIIEKNSVLRYLDNLGRS